MALNFKPAVQSPLSLVILDNIERLLEFVPIGPRFSNTLLQIVLELLEKPPPRGRKLMIIGTSSDAAVMGDLGVAKAFNMVFHVPLLKEAEIRHVFVETRSFAPQEVRPENIDDQLAVCLESCLCVLRKRTIM